jgi:hypothetical protein
LWLDDRGTNEVAVNLELRQAALALVICKQLRAAPLDPSQLGKLARPVTQPTNCSQMCTAPRKKMNLATASLRDDQRVASN